METFDAIYQRRAVKHYDPKHKMSKNDVRKLLDAAIQSPTSFNMQNWRFVVVQNKALRKKIRDASFDQAQVTDASLLIILTADLKAWNQNPKRYWRKAPKSVAKLLTDWMVPFYKYNDLLQRDEAMRSCGLAGQTIMLAAKAMGLDSCPMIGFDPLKVASLINLPEDHVIGFIITVGKATKAAWEKPGQLPLDQVVITNKFS